jgi:hypothetical protein
MRGANVEPETILDPLEFLRRLHLREVRYLLVGRQALVLLGAPLLSADYDFYLSPEKEDLEDVLAISRELGLEVSPRRPARAPFFTLLADTLKLDLFRARRYVTKGGEAFTFEEMFGRRRTIPVEDFAVTVPAIEDLIRTKLVRDLPRDREDIKYLQVLLERGEA